MGVRICLICMYACMCILFMYIYIHTHACVCLFVWLRWWDSLLLFAYLLACLLACLYVLFLFAGAFARFFFVCVCFRCMGYGLIFVVVRLMISGRGHFP